MIIETTYGYSFAEGAIRQHNYNYSWGTVVAFYRWNEADLKVVPAIVAVWRIKQLH